ncbi:hypothetical protein R1flu_018792 [Riccia fluitans]|uniref:Alpha-1,4 glucan phosphorylase n=1 Tax=Riccia fluitans TaxID=41844 RepID=A0ABD1ZKB7_9MARC
MAAVTSPICIRNHGGGNVAYKSSMFGNKLAEMRRSSLCVALCGNPTIQCVASEPRAKGKAADTSDHGKSIKPIANPSADDASSVASNIKYHAEYTPTFSPLKFDIQKAYAATAESVRDNLILRWNETYKHLHQVNPKHIHYLSMEFLQGRALSNAVGNLELRDAYGAALQKFGYDLEEVYEQEPDAALGNGGLGRLASCFLDSLATLNYPAWGYGLRYKYGLFHQTITKDGQGEVAEKWLELGHPWEVVRNDIVYPIKFYGKTVEGYNGKKEWVGGEDISVVAYDVPIPGYQTKNTISLRLWQTKASAEDFNLDAFNRGEHEAAARALNNAEKICFVLYPGDESEEGKALRLKQQYVLCSASLQDIIARFKERSLASGGKVNWDSFPSKVAIQMNDTHPTLSAPELMRILVDVEGLSWDQSWQITQATVAYTNHTVLPEALEKWPLDIFQKLLPRHYEIIERIDHEFIEQILTCEKFAASDLEKRVHHMRILHNVDIPSDLKSLLPSAAPAPTPAKTPAKKGSEEASATAPVVEKKVEKPKTVRMANLCVVAAHTVNGVAAIHSEIVKDEVFNDFYKLWPHKFQNKTNGVTPRRWLRFCNPELSKVITKWLGSEDWVLNTDKLAGLKKYADDKQLHREWFQAKRANKIKLAAYVKEKTGYTISPDSLFDIQVKRIHEYKRQLLNILGVIHRYKKMKEMSAKERKEKFVPRVSMFGGKAFATYMQAKRIVKLITDVAATVNNDPEIGDLMKVIFVPDYNVSVAEVLIPASELSEHISTAGMEASGTSNMKFCMNGCVLIGTLDGANVEIREEVGEENFFLFGARADEIAGLREERSKGKFKPSPEFEAVKKFIRSGVFGSYDYDPLIGSLEGNEGFGRADYFLVGKDFPAYIKAQEEVDEAYRDMDRWTRMSIMNTAGSPFFSSDRTIHQYAQDIWGIKPHPLP